MTDLEDRLADFITKLRMEAERAGYQQLTDSDSLALVREAITKYQCQIADDLQGFLQSTLQQNHATPGTVRGMREDLQTLATNVSILQQHLKKLEAAPVSVRSALLPGKALDSLSTKIQALGHDLTKYCKDIGTGLAAFGLLER